MRLVLNSIINIGIRDDNSFELNKQVRIINTISFYGSIACLFFLVTSIPFLIPAYTLFCLVCIVVLMLNFYFNKIRKYWIAKAILLFMMPIIVFSFSFFIGPIGNEYYLITELVFLFFLYKKTFIRILVFSYLTSCFVLLKILIHEEIIKLANPIFEYVFYPNIITSFVLTFLGLNLFYNEHIQYQNLVEAQNLDLTNKNREIERQNDDLEKLNNLKNKLFSVISHDLRGPLKSLLSMINMYENNYITTEQFKEHLPNLKEKIDNTSNMTENLLAWSKTQIKGLKPKYENFDLTETINNIIGVFEDSVKSKRLSVNVSISHSYTLYSDLEMVKTIIRNVFHNAIKFSNAGGKIELEVIEENDLTAIKISDEGKGIESSVVEKFNNDETLLSEKGTMGELGTGLGLVIAKDFVKLISGRIILQSTSGKGSVFFIEIPTYAGQR